jgi:hypothetical protein
VSWQRSSDHGTAGQPVLLPGWLDLLTLFHSHKEEQDMAKARKPATEHHVALKRLLTALGETIDAAEDFAARQRGERWENLQDDARGVLYFCRMVHACMESVSPPECFSDKTQKQIWQDVRDALKRREAELETVQG